MGATSGKSSFFPVNTEGAFPGGQAKGSAAAAAAGLARDAVGATFGESDIAKASSPRALDADAAALRGAWRHVGCVSTKHFLFDLSRKARHTVYQALEEDLSAASLAPPLSHTRRRNCIFIFVTTPLLLVQAHFHFKVIVIDGVAPL